MQTRYDGQSIADYYDGLAEQYGDAPEATNQSSRETQHKRYQMLMFGAAMQEQSYHIWRGKILDWGCGAGYWYGAIKQCRYPSADNYEYHRTDDRNLIRREDRPFFTGEYVGIDISPRMIEIARAAHPGVRFECRDILEEPLKEDYDYVFVSGVFNDRIKNQEPYISANRTFTKAVLAELWDHTQRMLAFNMFSIDVDYEDSGLWYVDPEWMFRWTRENLTPWVTLRNDYRIGAEWKCGFEFSVFCYRNPR